MAEPKSPIEFTRKNITARNWGAEPRNSWAGCGENVWTDYIRQQYNEYMVTCLNVGAVASTYMMTSWHRGAVHITAPFWGISTGTDRTLLTESKWCEALVLSLSTSWTNCWINNRDAVDFGCHNGNVMSLSFSPYSWLFCEFISCEYSMIFLWTNKLCLYSDLFFDIILYGEGIRAVSVQWQQGKFQL